MMNMLLNPLSAPIPERVLAIAVECCSPPLIELLAEDPAFAPAGIKHLVAQAARSEYYAVVEALLRNFHTPGENYYDAQDAAAAHGSAPIIEAIIRAGAIPSGNAAATAVNRDYRGIAKTLLDHGARFEPTNDTQEKFIAKYVSDNFCNGQIKYLRDCETIRLFQARHLNFLDIRPE
jgi:hypothetical protein